MRGWVHQYVHLLGKMMRCVVPPQERPESTAPFMTPSVLPIIEALDNQQCCRDRKVQGPVGNRSSVTSIETNGSQAKHAVHGGKSWTRGLYVLESADARLP